MQKTIPLPHQFTLFALDDNSGHFLTSGPYFSLPFFAACLVELYQKKCIDWSDQKIQCISPPESTDQVLSFVYNWLNQRTTRSIGNLFTEINSSINSIADRALDDLVSWGVLKRENHKLLWIFNTTRYPELQSIHENLIKANLKNIINKVKKADFTELALLSLLKSAKLLKTLESESYQGQKLSQQVSSLIEDANLSESEQKLLKQVDEKIIELFVVINIIT